MSEIIDLERLFSELGYKTYRKRWGVFRNALQGKGKEKLEYELERVGMTPDRIVKLTESEMKDLYEWAMSVLEKLIHLDPEKKCEIANETMKKVWMPPGSGPGGAERFIRDYEQAYLMELRAGLVASTELALSTRFIPTRISYRPRC